MIRQREEMKSMVHYIYIIEEINKKVRYHHGGGTSQK